MDINIFDTLRAKSSKENGEAETLYQHIKNALDRAKQLYNFIKSIDLDWEFFKKEDEKEIFFKNLTKAIILHDFGKIDYKFQWQLFTKEEKENNSHWEEIENFFSPKFRRIHFNRHEILSTFYASFLLDDSDWSEKIMTAILLHHYNNYFTDIPSLPVIIRDFEDEIREYMNFVSSQKDIFKEPYKKLLDSFLNDNDFSNITFMKEAIEELRRTEDWDKAGELFNSYYNDDLSEFVDFYEPKNKLSNQLRELDKDTYKFLVFLGALRRADYSSSGGVPIEGDRLEEILKFDRLAQEFKNKFKVSTLWQEEILKDKDSHKIKHLILIAPTGSGKTEFSLLWAAKNPRKFLYTLPLRVALNDLFVRFRGIKEFNPNDVDILHSTAFIEYVKESEGKYLDIESKITSSKLLSNPLLLTTPDQIFLTSLNYYGSDKVLSIYPTSNIVIDEIQTFNPEMAAIIIKTLWSVKFLGGNVLVMAATFPPYFSKFLEKDLGFQKLDISEYADKVEIKNYNRKRHRLKVIEENLFQYKGKDKGKGYEVEIKSEVEEDINKLLESKSNALIVVNNVKKAISMYKYLNDNEKNITKGYDVFLLHSRLIERYKTERIKEIKKRLEKKQKVIVVSTQIIEASVNFDFDFMITELSTIDSQIQRWGRVYRSRDKDYNAEEPNIVIFAAKIGKKGLVIDPGTSYVYDKDVLKATRDVLREYQNKLLSYKEEKEMIKETFKKGMNGLTLKDKYEKKIEETLNFLNYFSASKKSQAQRIFRRMAGIIAVVPALMKKDEREWVQKLAEIIETGQNNPWKEIIENIKKETGENIDNIWVLKAEIYNYSVAIPEFVLGMGKYRWHLSNEFKGFRVLKINEKEQIDNIKKYGLDGWLQELEDEEIDERIY